MIVFSRLLFSVSSFLFSRSIAHPLHPGHVDAEDEVFLGTPHLCPRLGPREPPRSLGADQRETGGKGESEAHGVPAAHRDGLCHLHALLLTQAGHSRRAARSQVNNPFLGIM